MDAEKLSVLKMIETGRVTADEGLRLLEAIDRSRTTRERTARRREWRRLRLLVTETGTGRRRSQVSIPADLVGVFLRLALKGANRRLRLDGCEVDPEEVLTAIEGGRQGLIADFTDDLERIRVEVFLE